MKNPYPHALHDISHLARCPRVIRVPEAIYRTIAEELLWKIRESICADQLLDFSTTVERDNGTYGWQYSIRCYVRHTTAHCPDGDDMIIEEVVPFWSEFKLWFSDEGEDLPNNFCADVLRDHGVPYNKPFTTMRGRAGSRCVSP